MKLWLKRATLVLSLLGLCAGATTHSMAQGKRGQTPAAVDAGVGAAGNPVVLRPSGAIEGQYIVVFEDGVSNARGLANALARQNRIELRGVYSTALKGFAARMPAAVAERLALDPDVAYVEADLYVHADELVTGIDRIDAELSLTAGIGFGGSVDVDVAVIDTGVDPHSDLNWSNDRFYDCQGGCVATNAYDDNGHGTHVAGSIGALDDGINDGTTEVVGVAPGARIWGFKVLAANGSGSLSDVISAIDLITQIGGIEVANMSLSAQGFLASFRTAIQNSVATGVVHVVAAGNAQRDIYGPNGVLDESSGNSVTCILMGRNCSADDTIPASYPEVMAVSAMGDFDGIEGGLNDVTVNFSSCSHTGDDVFACFTNYSNSVDAANPVVSPGGAIDVAGPGVLIQSTWPGGYATISGTSMASPHVAGAVALCIVEDCAGLGGSPVDAGDVIAVRQAIIDGAQPQSAWGPVDTKDPDGNAEGMVYVGGPPVAVMDLAVAAVTAPELVVINSMYNVSVEVANVGTMDAPTASVSLTDHLGAVIGAPQGVTLAAGQSEVLNFSWQPTEIGIYTLTGSHDLFDGDDTNDTASAEVQVSDLVIDAAITSVSAPSSVEVNTSQTVSVGVVNNSTQEETITIALTDNLDPTFSPAQDILLSAGQTTSVDFSWSPSVTGNHALTGTATLTGDIVPANNSMQATSAVTDQVLSVFAVDSVCYSGTGGRAANKHLNSTVTISDGASAANGATVIARVEDGSGAARSATGTTDTAGQVQFSWKGATVDETYTTIVESVNGDTSIVTPDNSVFWPNYSGSCSP